MNLESLVSPFLWIAVLAISYAVLPQYLPPEANSILGIYALKFFAFGFFLTISSWGLGQLVRRKLIGSEFTKADIALGLGVFSFVLNIYIKCSLNPFPFLLLLSLFFLYGVLLLAVAAKNNIALLNSWDIPVIALCVIFIVFTLSVGTLGGFLYFPTDFDSGLFHVTFPKLVVEHGSYFNPLWLRSPWLSQLTHNWYILILECSNDLFLKSLDVVCFIQILILFISEKDIRRRLFGALFFVLLSCNNEFKANISTTSMDAMLAVFYVPAIAVALFFFDKSKQRSDLILLALLCGFASGQKHFGIMFSAPLLAVSCGYYFFTQRKTFKEKLRFIGFSGGLAILFFFVFASFYIHNLFEGSALLFPFIGTRNSYGWTAADLKQMLESTIPHWGHSKTLLGFFLIPYYLIAFPNEYQFGLTHSWNDYILSIELSMLFLFIAAALFIKPLRSPAIVLPACILIAQLFGWYKGSQVIRYLFPILIAATYYFSWIIKRYVHRVPGRVLAPLCLALSIAGSAYTVTWSPFPIPLTSEARQQWLITFANPAVKALQWLREYSQPQDGVIYLSDSGIMQHLPERRLCGDWFAACNYSRFITTPITFKQWRDLKPEIIKGDFSYIMVTWNLFDGVAKRPNPDAQWDRAFPKSTLNCIEHVFYDGAMTDLFKIKPECRQQIHG